MDGIHIQSFMYRERLQHYITHSYTLMFVDVSYNGDYIAARKQIKNRKTFRILKCHQRLTTWIHFALKNCGKIAQ